MKSVGKECVITWDIGKNEFGVAYAHTLSDYWIDEKTIDFDINDSISASGWIYKRKPNKLPYSNYHQLDKSDFDRIHKITPIVNVVSYNENGNIESFIIVLPEDYLYKSFALTNDLINQSDLIELDKNNTNILYFGYLKCEIEGYYMERGRIDSIIYLVRIIE